MINPDICKIGYFLVWKNDGGALGNIIVKEQTNEGHDKDSSQYSHVGLSLGGFRSIDALIPKIRVIEDITKEFKGRYVKLVRPKILDYDDTKRKNVAVEALSRCNMPYGFFSLLWFKVNNIIWKKDNVLAKIFGYFCSYLCAYSLMKYYPNYMKKPAENCMPADFLNLDLFEVIWEGYV